jgi:dimethylamine monooxygenase subunit A
LEQGLELGMEEILQDRVPYDVEVQPGLPGIRPLAMQDWLIRDEALAGQMALRDRLLRESRAAVVALEPSAAAAARELLDLVLGLAYPDSAAEVDRPDGVRVTIDRDDPLGTLGRLVQEDFCILQKQGDEHVLTGAVLCFPASWTLGEKFRRPLVAIHDPVAAYDSGIAARVQRLFDGVQPGRPLWRFNALHYADPALHQPRSVHEPRPTRSAADAPFLRSERQSILRLPQTRAVVFAIHTYVVKRRAGEAADA